MPACGWRWPCCSRSCSARPRRRRWSRSGSGCSFALLWPALAQMVGEMISPSDIRFAQLGLPTPDTLAWQQGLSRLSPGTLYGEAVVAMLNPEAQSMTNLLAQFQGRIMGRRCRSARACSGLAADGQPDRRHDPALRGRLRRVPAAGGARVAHARCADSRKTAERAGPNGGPAPGRAFSCERSSGGDDRDDPQRARLDDDDVIAMTKYM